MDIRHACIHFPHILKKQRLGGGRGINTGIIMEGSNGNDPKDQVRDVGEA